jgi:hypothetical protein
MTESILVLAGIFVGLIIGYLIWGKPVKKDSKPINDGRFCEFEG